MMHTARRSGILLHPTSLPGPYGVGTFNQDAYRWVDFMASTHQTLWQVLPLGPTGYGDSPYQSFSSFAGNPSLISLEDLLDSGLVDPLLLDQAPVFDRQRVDFGLLYTWKRPLLRQIAEEFPRRASAALQAEFAQFCAEQAGWLDDYALFMALKDAHQGAPWNQWGMPLRSRQPAALAAASARHAAAHKGPPAAPHAHPQKPLRKGAGELHRLGGPHRGPRRGRRVPARVGAHLLRAAGAAARAPQGHPPRRGEHLWLHCKGGGAAGGAAPPHKQPKGGGAHVARVHHRGHRHRRGNVRAAHRAARAAQ